MKFKFRQFFPRYGQHSLLRYFIFVISRFGRPDMAELLLFANAKITWHQPLFLGRFAQYFLVGTRLQLISSTEDGIRVAISVNVTDVINPCRD